jgi:hypothetical protein
MEAGKLGPEKAPSASKGGVESQHLQSTVNTIITSIERAQKEDRELLDATFKRAAIPGVSGKSGIEKALKTLAIVKKLKGRTFDEVKSLRYNNWLWNRIVSLLRRAALLKGATAAEAGLTKKAAEEAPPGFGGAPARRGRGRARGKAERQDVMALQGLMDKLNYDLGPAGVDGKWGPKTAGAWEKLRKEVAAMKGPALPPAAPAKSVGPPANAVRLAAQVAAYLLSVRGEPAKAVNLAPGIRVPESALASPQAFVSALARVPASGVRFVGRRDMFSKENLAKASDLLSKYRDALRQPGNPEAWNIWTKGGGAPALKRRIQAVDALLAQLPRAGAKVPPMGYEYEGGTARLPFGTLEGGPGMPGYKPGKPGGAGGAGGAGGRPGYSDFFSPRSVVGEALKLLPDDLLDAMANTRQFIWYANYPAIRDVLKYWRKQGRDINEIRSQLQRGKRDKKAIALTYIEFLRDSLGRLRRRLSQVGERRLGADAQKIKDRIALAVSYMSTLEDDLRYGAL